MSIDKSSVSEAQSYREIGEFWDAHDLGEFWPQTRPAEFEIDIQSQTVYYPVDMELSRELRRIADTQGIPAQVLLNQWVREKTTETQTVGAAE